MTPSEKATQKSTTRPRLSVHHKSSLWALFREFVRSTTRRFLACSGAGLPFSEIAGARPRSLGRSRVASESWPRSRCTVICSGKPSSARRVSSVPTKSGEPWRSAGAGRCLKGRPVRVHRHRALDAPLAPVHLAPTGPLAAAGGLRYAAQSMATSDNPKPMARS
jgi:hypothetical protein